MDITELLAFSVQHNASDLHLSTGTPPLIRVDGDVRKLNIPAFDAKDVNALVYDIMNDRQRKEYEENLEVDFSFEVPNLARFRVNAFNQNRGPAAVFRTIPSKILSLDDLGCPDIFRDISDTPRGLVLVTGPTGSGKSTTLAAMVDYINSTKHDHILTIEDPIEFVHELVGTLKEQLTYLRESVFMVFIDEYENLLEYQQKVIKNYYDNREQIDGQRLSELVTNLFLSEGKKREKLWLTARFVLGLDDQSRQPPVGRR